MSIYSGSVTAKLTKVNKANKISPLVVFAKYNKTKQPDHFNK